MTDTCRCDRPLPDGFFVCPDCCKQAQTDLANISDYALWADDKRARRCSNLWVGGAIHAAETPLPYDPRVSNALNPAHNTLTAWARVIVDELNPADPPPAETDLLAAWHIDLCERVGTRPWAGEAFDDWERHRHRLETVFDNPPEKVYAGRCGTPLDTGNACPESLYAERSRERQETIIQCRRCGTQHDVDQRRDQLAAAVDSYLGTAKEIARLLRIVLGEEVDERLVRACEAHGLVASRGTRLVPGRNGRQYPAALYRIGQVREAVGVLEGDEAKRRAVRRTARGARLSA